MHHLQILKATLSETDALIERTETARLGYETLGDADGARVQAQKLKELLNVGSQLATQIEVITGKNADMVASFRNGFETVAEGWRATATNFSNIGSSFATNIVDGLSGGFTDFAMNVKSADEALKDFGNNMLRMAIQMLSQKALQMVFGSIFGGVGGAVAGGLSSTISSSPNSSAGTGWDGLGAASGGLLPGTPSRRDNMLIAAASGEFVIPAHRVQQYGPETFEMYRQGRMPQGFASGGIIGGTGAVPSFSSGGGGGTSVTVNVNVADGEIKNSSATAIGKNAEQLGQTMKMMAERTMAEHRRQGGMFAGRRRR
jgi:lambda family phage tail tape measure protein